MDVEQVYVNHTQQQPSWLENERRRSDVRLLLMGAVLNNNASGQDGDPMAVSYTHLLKERNRRAAATILRKTLAK